MENNWKQKFERFKRHASDKSNFERAIRVALVVGTILMLINHIDAFISWKFPFYRILQIGLTYMVPFCVSLYSAAQNACDTEEKRHKKSNNKDATYQRKDEDDSEQKKKESDN